MDWLFQSVGSYVDQGRQLVEVGVKSIEDNIVQFDTNVRELVLGMSSSENQPEQGEAEVKTEVQEKAGEVAAEEAENKNLHLSNKENDHPRNNLTEKKKAPSKVPSITMDLNFGNDISVVSSDVVNFAKTLTIEDFLRESTSIADQHVGDYQMNAAEQKHAMTVLNQIRSLAQIRYQLIPSKISEYKFWRIYFIFISKFLQYELVKDVSGNASLNSTPPPISPQVLSRSASFVNLPNTSRSDSFYGKSDDDEYLVIHGRTPSADGDLEKDYVTEFELPPKRS